MIVFPHCDSPAYFDGFWAEMTTVLPDLRDRMVVGALGAVHAMVDPLRRVAEVEAEGGRGADRPYSLRLTTRSHLRVVVAPGSATAAWATQVPLSGHNVVLTVAAEEHEVVVERIGLEVVGRAPLEADGVNLIHPRALSPFSADFLDAVHRSTRSFEPLSPPDLELDLDTGALGAVDGSSAFPFPLRVAPWQTGRLVLAPITDASQAVRWTLRADVGCGGITERVSWNLSATAETTFRTLTGPARGRSPRVEEIFPDHWRRGASYAAWQQIDASSALWPLTMPMAHSSVDGGFVMRRPAADEQTPREAAVLRERGARQAARGREKQARKAFEAAAYAGDAELAWMLAAEKDAAGETAEALRLYTTAAERGFPLAHNDLGMLYFRLGELERAEHWYRRGMDAGDWTAAAGLCTLLAHRRDPDAEALLRLVAETSAANMVGVTDDVLARSDRLAAAIAQDLLGDLAREAGRHDEAVALWRRAAGNGNLRSAYSLGQAYLGRGDRQQAQHWLEQAAEAGMPIAACRLGNLFAEDGDPAQAEHWWRRAAETLERTLRTGASRMTRGPGTAYLIGDLADTGEAEAAYELAMLLLRRARSGEAERWLTLAAQAGYRPARLELEARSAKPGAPGALGRDRLVPGLPPDAIRQGDWFVLPSPGWSAAATAAARVPLHAMVGGWRLSDDGSLGPFEPNPGYVPADEHTPSDPIDALLRRVAAGSVTPDLADRLLRTIRDSVLDIGCDGEGWPLVGPAPDGVPCLAVVTAAVHRQRLPFVVGWERILGGDLPRAAPDGVDVLFNPFGPAQFRLRTAVLLPSAELPSEADPEA
ncbi:sel1 repeat family protein [Actinospica durhamensis]|uniref:Sel1 repeat family protein n=1 Tax=Actinospica durhamensis TaxID=1508375 RepID=A0A941EXH0_9ACTN|nr:type VII secretion system-associated protein [Actinospica durhamensis]MBR7836799.1 sel1 repeat family protein [Actinospica durhamensis]